MKFFIQIFCFLIVVNSYAETSLPSSGDQTNSTNPFNETKIPIEKVVLEIPTTSMDALKNSFSKKSIPWWAGIIGSTLILLNNDEVILENWQREGRAAGIGNLDNTKAVLSAGEIDITNGNIVTQSDAIVTQTASSQNSVNLNNIGLTH